MAQVDESVEDPHKTQTSQHIHRLNPSSSASAAQNLLISSKSPGRPTLYGIRQLAELFFTNVPSTLIRWKQQDALKPIEELTTIGELRSPELTTYDRRVEKARGDEYDRRLEYDFGVPCQMRRVSTAGDFELQVRRLDGMSS